MAQLVIKREPWWSTPFGKQVMIWVPVAGLQAATLAGLGYFYDRLSEMELYSGTGLTGIGSVRDIPVATEVEANKPQQLVVASVSAPVSGVVSLQPALAMDTAKNTMRVGETFSAAADRVEPAEAASVMPSGVPVVSKKERASSPHSTVKKTAVAKKKIAPPKTTNPVEWSFDVEARRTATANLAGIRTTGAETAAVNAVPVTPLPTANPSRPFDGGLTPVGIVTWIYIGELRDYGWHGQMLHVAAHSGLPEVGRNYRTQKIHGLYEQPHGKRVMAGFQQGDTVTVLDVMQEVDNKVWAKVRKVRSYGR